MTENLKRCPFCGGEAKCIEFYGLYHVICCNCYVAGKDCSTRESAVSAWNSRPVEDELHGRIEELESENKRLREALEVILDSAQKDEPCILAIKTVAYTALKGENK